MRNIFACAKVQNMKLALWLDAERGRLTKLAAHFGISQSAAYQWRTRGVPVDRIKAVRDFTGGAVTLDDMLPEPITPDHPVPVNQALEVQHG